jgi:hypothetical protein
MADSLEAPVAGNYLEIESNTLATIKGIVESEHQGDPVAQLDEYRKYLHTFAEADRESLKKTMPEDVADTTRTTFEDQARWVENQFQILVKSERGETAQLLALVHATETQIRLQEVKKREAMIRVESLRMKEAELKRMQSEKEDLDGLNLDTSGLERQIREIQATIDSLRQKV